MCSSRLQAGVVDVALEFAFGFAFEVAVEVAFEVVLDFASKFVAASFSWAELPLLLTL
jgi:hypothetical protein